MSAPAQAALTDEQIDADWREACKTHDLTRNMVRAFARTIYARAAIASAEACTCPSGDGSLRWPCPAHPPAPTQPVADIFSGAAVVALILEYRDEDALPEDLVRRVREICMSPEFREFERDEDEMEARFLRLVRSLVAAPHPEQPGSAT